MPLNFSIKLKLAHKIACHSVNALHSHANKCNSEAGPGWSFLSKSSKLKNCCLLQNPVSQQHMQWWENVYSVNRTIQNFKKDVHVWDDVDAVSIKYFIIFIYRHRTFVALLPQSTATQVITL